MTDEQFNQLRNDIGIGVVLTMLAVMLCVIICSYISHLEHVRIESKITCEQK